MSILNPVLPAAPRFASGAPPVYVHRALHGTEYPAPENSKAAIIQTAKEGLGIEFDVRLTADGQVVVHHDFRTGRIFKLSTEAAKAAPWDPAIHDLPYDALKDTRPNFNKPPKPPLTRRLEDFILGVKHHAPAEEFQPEQVPLLKDVLGTLQQQKQHTPLLVELKVLTQKDAPGLSNQQVQEVNQTLARKTATVLHEAGYEDNVTLIGFDGAMLKTAKETDEALHGNESPKLQTGLIPFPTLLDARLPGPLKPQSNEPTHTSILESLVEGLLCRRLPYRKEKLDAQLQQWKDGFKLDAILPSYGEVNETFMQSARTLGLKVLPGRCWERSKTEAREVQRLQKLGVDGFVVTHGARTIQKELQD